MLRDISSLAGVSSRDRKEATVDASDLVAERDAFMARQAAGARDPGLWRDCGSDKRVAKSAHDSQARAPAEAARAERRVRFSDEDAADLTPPAPDAPCGPWIWIALVVAVLACVIALAVGCTRSMIRH